MKLACILLAMAAFACGPGAPGGPANLNKMGGNTMGPPPSQVVTQDILDREPVANTASVKHILISWKDQADAFGGHLDPRAAKRSKSDAEAEVKKILEEIKGGADFDGLMKTRSEDPGSASTARAYPVTPDAQLVIEFRQLALRLKVGEVGVVQSDFGFHIMKRLQ